ncbi:MULTISPECIES: 3'-5' exonuclease [Deefgea]|uniref:3'-5' exonuclease n=1 Tax=Deefgea chitinilytica TaxID=570276 RepID=A0ABS2CHJ0_9NEIS|nr:MULTISPECIES: 3'-5' exonuclease [Deefgea]MBM5572841.1 3'-5' exonuclease [Deefgea chitinilytica]MBM9890078.1 3'-5' exonuclease [Deefgea sp. CFH1-16]
MIRYLQQWLRQRQLRDARFDFLFAPVPSDEWVSIDCETSSLNPKQAEILSIAAVMIRGNTILKSTSRQWLVKPSGPIDPKTIPIHGLRQQDVNEGLTLHDALTELLLYIGSRPLVGYYLEFDLAVINRQLKPWLGINLPNQGIDVSGLYYDKKVSAYRPEVDLSLKSILTDLALPELPRHDPMNDALTAAMIFLKLSNQVSIQRG